MEDIFFTKPYFKRLYRVEIKRTIKCTKGNTSML